MYKKIFLMLFLATTGSCPAMQPKGTDAIKVLYSEILGTLISEMNALAAEPETPASRAQKTSISVRADSLSNQIAPISRPLADEFKKLVVEKPSRTRPTQNNKPTE